jgi:Na+-translocating ferredoxin:NAD+ oxidoreductase RnfC subunit
MRKVTNFFFTNKRQEITKNQTAISNRRSILKHKTLAKLFLYTSCLMTLSKLLRCCNCNACNWFSNSEADEFRKYSFCQENHRYKLSFKLSKSTEQKIDRMSKYTEQLYPEQQNKQWLGYKYLQPVRRQTRKNSI